MLKIILTAIAGAIAGGVVVMFLIWLYMVKNNPYQ